MHFKKFLIIALPLVFFFMAACNSKPNTPPSSPISNFGPGFDGDGVMGNKEKTYISFNKAEQKATIISVIKEEQKANRYLKEPTTPMQDLGEIAFSLVHLSADEKTLTLEGDTRSFYLVTASLIEADKDILAVVAPLPIEGSTTHRIFVTTTTMTGSLGGSGLTSAIQTCNSEGRSEFGANTNWVPLVSTSTSDAASRVTMDGTFYNTRLSVHGNYTNGPQIVATSLAQLWSGALTNSPDFHKDGSSAMASIWSGSTAAGTYSGDNCSDWTDGTPGSNGTLGISESNTPTWISLAMPTLCSMQNAIYCVEQ